MTHGALLRFGPFGTLLLAAFPSLFGVRYLVSRRLARHTLDTRPLSTDERTRLEDSFDDAGLPVAEVMVATGVGDHVAGLSGTPGKRLFLVSETTLETATTGELAGLVGIAAGKHEVRLPEWYSGYLVATSTAFSVAVGVDPSGLGSPAAAALVVVILLLIAFGGFPVLRGRVYRADRVAVQRVGRKPVEAAIGIVPTRRMPRWVPAVLQPKPTADRRLREL